MPKTIATDCRYLGERSRRNLQLSSILAVTWLLLACQGESGSTNAAAELDHAGHSVADLVEDTVSASPAIGIPVRLRIQAKNLWVLDAARDPAIHLIDLTTNTLVHSFGRRGEGPGEFSTRPTVLAMNPSDSTVVWGWDAGLQRLTRLEPRNPNEYTAKSFQLRGTPTVARIAWIAPDRIIGVSTSSESRFALFSIDGSRERNVVGRLLGSPDIPIDERIRATSAGMGVCGWPGRGFVMINFTVSRIEYYDRNASYVRHADVPFSWEAKFEQDDGGTIRFSPERSAYLGCSVAEDHLFALFSGRLHAAFDDWREQDEGRFVHVFDWDGDLEHVFRLATPVRAITVAPDAAAIYAGSVSDAGIYRFQLPSLELSGGPNQ